MCLIVKSKNKLIAQKDISCYKIFRDQGNELVSPYRLTSFLPNVLYTDTKKMSSTTHFISAGVFHSFKSKTSAKAQRYYLATYMAGTKFVIYKCRIPKGSIYYEGETYSGDCKKRYKSYGSKQIELLNEV